MTNEEKAKSLVGSKPLSSMITTADFEKLAVEMAQWKDEQFAKEKQQLIDKAAEWFSYRFPNISKKAFEKFKEDMKGE